jgi:hypothetical protein
MNSKKKMVDVTGIEPVTPCLQSIGADSIRSIHYFQLLTFPTNRGTRFSLNANPNRMKTLDSCTVRAQVRGIRLHPWVQSHQDLQSAQHGRCFENFNCFIWRTRHLPPCVAQLR